MRYKKKIKKISVQGGTNFAADFMPPCQTVFYLKAIKKPRPWAGFWLGSPMLMRLRQPFRFWLESVDPSGDFHFQQPSRKT